MEADKEITLVTQLDPAEDDPERDDMYNMGVSATVLQLLKLPDGTVRVLVEGKQRGSLEAIEQAGTHLTATVALIDDAEAEGTEVAALMRSVIDQFENYAKLNRQLPAATQGQLSEIDSASPPGHATAGNISHTVA